MGAEQLCCQHYINAVVDSPLVVFSTGLQHLLQHVDDGGVPVSSRFGPSTPCFCWVRPGTPMDAITSYPIPSMSVSQAQGMYKWDTEDAFGSPRNLYEVSDGLLAGQVGGR